MAKLIYLPNLVILVQQKVSLLHYFNEFNDLNIFFKEQLFIFTRIRMVTSTRTSSELACPVGSTSV